MKSIKNVSFYNSRVFVRCDFNVPIIKSKTGEMVVDDFKIERTLPTINYLRKSGAKIILVSHLGRPQSPKKKGKIKKLYSLKPVKKAIENLLGEKIQFSEKIVGGGIEKKIGRMKPGQIILLENLRFDKREEENDPEFARELARLADSYVNEAFSVCHRKHASIVGLPKLLPHFIGLEAEKEVNVLSSISQEPRRPLTIIIGGVKISSKIKMIERFLKFSDFLLFGGEIASNILRVKGISIGQPWPEEKTIDIIKKIRLTDTRVHLPVDVLASPDSGGDVYVRETAPGNIRKGEGIFDIGPETIKTFSRIIKASRTIFWSGPLGFFENKKFSRGTKEIARAIADCQKPFKVAGGGDTAAAIREFGLLEKFSFVSIGGGAMLSFLAGEKLPGLEVLKTMD